MSATTQYGNDKRPYEVRPKGHVWKTNDYDRGIDIFGYDCGDHNGPVCVNCGYGFCHHCRELPESWCPKAKKPKKAKKAKRK